MLDVNKIHFLLATVTDTARLVAAMEARLEASRDAYALETTAHYRASYAHANRWDPADVIYVKRMLQMGLPEDLRVAIADDLFREFVTTDERAFAQELYVTLEQLQCMVRHGMHVGSHGHDHLWLNTLSTDEQEREVRTSLDFLRLVGADLDAWTLGYPYGGVDERVVDTVRRLGCRVALTTEVDVADLDRHHPLTLPRLDTNDLPRRADAPTGAWTLEAP